MISSASTLLLATLVFNAASVFGAPLRIPDTVSEVVARAELSTPVQPVARADIVDVEDHRRRSQIGTVSRRAARLVMERDEPFSEVVAAREPEPSVEQKREEELRQRRYPRRILHDFYEKREPEPEPQPAIVEEPVARALRYPRRILHDLYEKREPATSVKETTLITTKVTVHDTPADAAAFAMGQAAGANAANVGASASTLSISIPLPSIPAVLNANAASGASTVVSISQTTTITSPDASATASSAAVATGTASASASAVTAAPTESASSSASAASVSASSTASSTATSSAAAPEATGTTGGDKAAGGDNKAGDDKAAAAATPAAAAAGSGEPTVDGTTSVPASNESRRWVKASTAPVARRMAVSGASWASAVRRQLTSITSDSE